MKRTFDWLRDYIYRNTYKSDVEVITQEDALAMVDEAEAKWEAEACEWEFEKNTGLVWHCENECESYNISYQRELKTFLEEFECKCPHCRKPIKISEVE